MSENRLPDYLHHMQQAAKDACTFVDGHRFSGRLLTVSYGPSGRKHGLQGL